MTNNSVLEIARLRGLIARLRRQYGEKIALEFLQRAIESELAVKND